MWTDYGFPNITLSPQHLIMSGLAAALNERRAIVYQSAITPPVPLSPSFDYYGTRTYPYKVWFAAFESALNTTIPKYVNHTVNGGCFTGLASIPMWTKKAIYEYLNETEIVYSDCILAPLLWSRYLFQKYRVINLLRWIVMRYYTSAKFVRRAVEGDSLSAKSWNGLVGKFAAGSWVPAGYGWLIEYQVSGGYESFSVSNANTGQVGVIINEIYYRNLGFMVDCYCTPFLESRLTFQPFSVITDKSMIGKVNYLRSVSNTVASEFFYLFDWNEFFLDGKIIPDNNTMGFSATPGPFIGKFDVPDGFKFRGEDW